jgi:hypothetical protein
LVLCKTIGRKVSNFDQLITVLKEVEAVVNSRPVEYVGDDFHSTIVIMLPYSLGLNPNTGIPNACTIDKVIPILNQQKHLHKRYLKSREMFWSL